jgi:hypothetical protein
MKRILALFCLLAGCLAAQSQTVDLGSRGKLTFYFVGDWKVDVADYGDRKMLTVTPTNDAVNATCSLTITFPEKDRYDTKSRLRLRVEADGEKMAEGSVEGKAIAKEYSVRTGYGFHCDFTDPELVGKPPQPGNYKTISAGLIHVAPDVLVEVAVSADGFKSEPYQQILGALEGMEYEEGKGK